MIISGKIKQKNDYLLHLGIKLSGNQCDIRINQENKKRAALAHALPILLIEPKNTNLLEGGAQIRREFIDWRKVTMEKMIFYFTGNALKKHFSKEMLC